MGYQTSKFLHDVTATHFIFIFFEYTKFLQKRDDEYKQLGIPSSQKPNKYWYYLFIFHFDFNFGIFG